MKLELALTFDQAEFLRTRSEALRLHFRDVYGVDEDLSPEELVLILIDKYRDEVDPDPGKHAPQPTRV